MVVKFKKTNPKAVIPTQGREGDAAWDLTAVSDGKSVWDENKEEYLYTEYETGIAIAVPEDYVGLIFPRSSVTNKGLIMKNCVGVIDSNFRGGMTARFWETDIPGFASIYKAGDKIAQLIVIPRPFLEFEEVQDLGETNRGTGAYGSSDKLKQ